MRALSKAHVHTRPWPRDRCFTTARVQYERRQHQADVLIVGSGCAGLSAALRCHQHGLKPLVVEKSDKVGGTSAWSGGGLWVPCNSLYRKQGVEDSEEKALEYLNGLIGDVGPASSTARRRAYVRNATKVVDAFSELGCSWVPTRGMPDYHSDLPGALLEGRSIEPALFNAKQLGAWRKDLNPPSIFAGPPMHIYEGIQAANITTAKGIRAVLKILFRWLGLRLIGQHPVGMGQALTGQLLKANLDRNTEIWKSAAMKTLNVDDAGNAVGATFTRNNENENDNDNDNDDIVVTANAVILAAGGFAKNDAMRQRYQQQPTDANWSSVTRHDTGEVMQCAIDVGAATAMMDQAWWNPTFLNPIDNKPIISFGERGRPGAIMVDAKGQRFMNEAESYNDTGRHTYAHNAQTPAIPAWLIFDSRFLKHTPLRMLGPRLSERDGLRSKFLHKSTTTTLADLARQINVDAAGLEATVQRFNGFALTGKDLDFHRGETALECMGIGSAQDGLTTKRNNKHKHKHKHNNPSLAPLEKPPYYAVRMYPGDIGTKGGLLTDEHARVLRAQDGEVIQGLYAAGNTTASVMGHRYAGAGATLGPAMVFAALAVDHAAGRADLGEK